MKHGAAIRQCPDTKKILGVRLRETITAKFHEVDEFFDVKTKILSTQKKVLTTNFHGLLCDINIPQMLYLM